MTKDEALKLALEALGKVRVMLDNEYNVLPNGEAHEDVVASITAIREALAQPQQEPLTNEMIWEIYRNHAPCVGFARAIEAAHGITGEQE